MIYKKIMDKPFDIHSAVGSANRSIEEKNAIRFAQEHNLGYINAEKLNINPDFLKIIEEKNAKQGEIFSFFKVGKKIRLAMVNYNNPKTIEVIENLKKEGYEVNINIISQSSLQDGLEQYQYIRKQAPKIIQHNIEIDVDIEKSIHSGKPADIMNDIFIKALSEGASDIHLEPGEKKSIIRYRIDGILRKIIEIDPSIFQDIIVQIKHQSKLKLNVTRRPQDGRTFFMFQDRKVDVRVSSLPSSFGEDIVLRILDNNKNNLELSDLGMNNTVLQQLKQSLSTPNGMIIVTGPTGSGKTTTLYTILQALNTDKRKIITLEDPIEYQLPGITQSQIDEHENYNFADGLRSILRQDPDVIMVGEIRDKETAEVAAQAALTGHMVLTTLHTNSAVGAISRLKNMGLPSFMISSAVELIIAQRLVRRVQKDTASHTALEESTKQNIQEKLNTINTITGQNYICPDNIIKVQDEKEGYKGRLGLYESIFIDDNIQEMILNEKSDLDILQYAKSHGMLSISQDGILKVLEEKTTLEEVYRVSE